jgi:hypothetical protein
LTAARALDPEGALELIGAVRHLKGDQRAQACREALSKVPQLPDPGTRAYALIDLATAMPHDMRSLAAAAARAIEDASARATALRGLSKLMYEVTPNPLYTEALTLAQNLEDAALRAQALASFVELIPAPQQADMVRMAWTATRASNDPQTHINVLWPLAARMSVPLLSQAISTARSFSDQRLHAEALCILAPCLPEPQRTELIVEAFNLAKHLTDDWARADIISLLAPHCSAELRNAALTEAYAIGDEWARSDVLGELADSLPADERHSVILQALQTARSAKSTWVRTRALTGVARHLTS